MVSACMRAHVYVHVHVHVHMHVHVHVHVHVCVCVCPCPCPCARVCVNDVNNDGGWVAMMSVVVPVASFQSSLLCRSPRLPFEVRERLSMIHRASVCDPSTPLTAQFLLLRVKVIWPSVCQA